MIFESFIFGQRRSFMVRIAGHYFPDRNVLLLLLPAAFLLVWLPLCDAQGLGTVNNFKAIEYFEAPNETQKQSFLQSARAQQQEDGRFLMTDMTVQTYATNGVGELNIRAPQCLYDRKKKSANSAGPLRVTTADGKFWIEGEGFYFDQTTRGLWISNKVHTFIHSDMLNTRTNKASAQPANDKSSSIEVFSEQFAYSAQTGDGLYERNVRVTGTNQMSLLSQRLAFRLPVKERQLQTINADENVVIDYEDARAIGRHATYTADSGLVKLSGNPSWKSEQREGRGDILTVDRTNRVFRADGNAWVRMPAQNLKLSSLISEPGSGTAQKTTASTNQFVEIASSFHEFRTNWAQFGGGVEAKEFADKTMRATMRCDQLEVTYSGTNQLNTLSAAGHFRIQSATNSLAGGHGEFEGTNGVLTVTERPSWASGVRSGKGDIIRVFTRTNEMLVKGNASMTLPAQELARAADPRNVQGTNSQLQPKPDKQQSTNSFAQVFCGDYTMNQGGVQFRGGVYASHPQMNWACELLTVHLPPQGGQVDKIIAETGVAFDVLDNKGQPVHGIGDKVVYTFDVVDGKTNDLLVLTGRPAVLHTSTSTNTVPAIVYDRINNIIKNVGNFTITTSIKNTDSNALVLPNNKLTK